MINATIMDHGVALPYGVGRAAHYGGRNKHTSHPQTVATLKEVSDTHVDGTSLKFVDPSPKDGIVVLRDDTDQYFALEEDDVEQCIEDLVTQTDLVIQSCWDSFEPSFEDEDDGGFRLRSKAYTPYKAGGGE